MSLKCMHLVALSVTCYPLEINSIFLLLLTQKLKFVVQTAANSFGCTKRKVRTTFVQTVPCEETAQWLNVCVRTTFYSKIKSTM